MFQPGELVVYGSTGVCRVEEIAGLDQPGGDRNKRYYLLRPLWQDGVIYAPVDSEKVPMRPVISREEAEALIEQMPAIQAAACRGVTAQALAQQYQAAVRDGGHQALIEMMKQAERMLYGELATALGIGFDEVEPYIASRIEGGAAEAGA